MWTVDILLGVAAIFATLLALFAIIYFTAFRGSPTPHRTPEPISALPAKKLGIGRGGIGPVCPV